MQKLIKRSITGIAFALTFIVTFLYLPPIAFTLLLLSILAEILFFEWPQLMLAHNKTWWLITPFYPILPFFLLLYMNHHNVGRSLLPILFTAVWSYDVGAYCIGKVIGQHKLAPTISPGKTWEGFVGGIIFCMLALTTLFFYYAIPVSYPKLIFISFVICSIATLGDLFESWLKRKSGIKDTGSILPGHGGFLDRFDSVLFVTIPFFIYCFFGLNS